MNTHTLGNRAANPGPEGFVSLAAYEFALMEQRRAAHEAYKAAWQHILTLIPQINPAAATTQPQAVPNAQGVPPAPPANTGVPNPPVGNVVPPIPAAPCAAPTTWGPRPNAMPNQTATPPVPAAPAGWAAHRVKLNTPSMFDGDSSKVDGFLASCYVAFAGDPMLYADNCNRILFALLYMTEGHADLFHIQCVDEIVSNTLTASWAEFEGKLKAKFVKPSCDRINERELKAMCQGQDEEASKFFLRFDSLRRHIDVDDHTLCLFLDDAIDSRILDLIALQCDHPCIYEDYKNLVIRVDDRFRRRLDENHSRSSGSQTVHQGWNRGQQVAGIPISNAFNNNAGSRYFTPPSNAAMTASTQAIPTGHALPSPASVPAPRTSNAGNIARSNLAARPLRRNIDMAMVMCHNCRKFGHYMRDCTSPQHPGHNICQMMEVLEYGEEDVSVEDRSEEVDATWDVEDLSFGNVEE